jgi:6-phosphogluconolactonase
MMNYLVFETAQKVVESLAKTMKELSKENRPVHISLSGGSTPKLLFRVLIEAPYQDSIQWHNLHFWWGDERCVVPSDPDSNFGEAHELLFTHIDIPEENLHRIRGEEPPKQEALRFADEMNQIIPHKNGLPSFDWILLGMGPDGHTASLFPNRANFNDQHLSTVAKHPESGQFRVSKTAKLIENSDSVTYLVLGESKAEILREIQQNPADSLAYPAARVKSTNGKTEWYLDLPAAKFLTKGEQNER